MKHIYIIRHGQTDFNLKGIVQGSGIDSDLNAKGKAQGAAFFNQYQHINFDLIITSTLKRTAQTVDQFIRQPITHLQSSMIDEMHWGIHEGKVPTGEMKKAFKQVVYEWSKGNYNVRTKEGESANELKERLLGFIELLKASEAEHILVCTHGRTIRALMTLLLNRPLSDMDSIKHANTALYQFTYNDDVFTPVTLCDVRHLESKVN